MHAELSGSAKLHVLKTTGRSLLHSLRCRAMASEPLCWFAASHVRRFQLRTCRRLDFAVMVLRSQTFVLFSRGGQAGPAYAWSVMRKLLAAHGVEP